MTDIQNLKALAEAATPGPWTVSEEHESASFQGYVAGDADGWIAIFGTTNQDGDNADYVAAANPAAVLELITEIESLREANKTVECRFEVSEDTLKTIRGCLASAESDIDQLKAENTDLHVTLQAAKGEIERLKGENEALRKALTDIRENSHDLDACECAADALADARKGVSHD